MTETVSRRPLWIGITLCLTALALGATGVGLGGPLDPSNPRPLLARTLEWSALPVAILGGTLIAIWLGRRAAADEATDDGR